MPLTRDESGIWTASLNGSEVPRINPVVAEAMPRYLTIFDELFTAAKRMNELEFLFCLFRVRGFQNAGWDPYQTTLESIPPLLDCATTIQNDTAARHLHLWIYGHIVEASEPYELLANLLEVARGRHYAWNTNFPAKKSGAPQSPGEKTRRIEKLGIAAKLPNTAIPLKEVWDRELRNAVFHSNYVLYGSEVRILNPSRTFSDDEILTLVNRAVAYHSALAMIFKLAIEAYDEPTTIPTSPHFRGDSELRWRIVVREGYGVAGVKDAWSCAQLRSGKITVRVGRFFEDELRMLNSDPTLDRLPPRSEQVIP